MSLSFVLRSDAHDFDRSRERDRAVSDKKGAVLLIIPLLQCVINAASFRDFTISQVRTAFTSAVQCPCTQTCRSLITGVTQLLTSKPCNKTHRLRQLVVSWCAESLVKQYEAGHAGTLENVEWKVVDSIYAGLQQASSARALSLSMRQILKECVPVLKLIELMARPYVQSMEHQLSTNPTKCIYVLHKLLRLFLSMGRVRLHNTAEASWMQRATEERSHQTSTQQSDPGDQKAIAQLSSATNQLLRFMSSLRGEISSIIQNANEQSICVTVLSVCELIKDMGFPLESLALVRNRFTMVQMILTTARDSDSASTVAVMDLI